VSQPANYFSAWDGIVARLKEQVTEFNRHVYPFMSLDDAKRIAQFAPACVVVYTRDRVGESSGAGQAQVVSQQFTVVVALKSANDAESGKGAREAAGPLITKVLAALAGFTPAVGWRPLKRAEQPALVDYSPGVAWFPFGFSTTLITHP